MLEQERVLLGDLVEHRDYVTVLIGVVTEVHPKISKATVYWRNFDEHTTLDIKKLIVLARK